MQDDATVHAVDDFTRTLTLRGIDPNTLMQDEDGTIIAAPPSRDDDIDGDAIAALPPLHGGLAGPQIEILDRLGEGGMAQVSLAIQVPLDREVAVKVLRNEEATPRAANALLREAQVLGALEHPNIAPVHMLGRDERELPMLVMKRVAGTAWSEFIGAGKPPRAPQDAPDALEWNLQILMQVCNAIHYAHSRGVLHRDVKPSNVMIGEFGEVYLMDWGIAVAIGEKDRYGLRSAAGVDNVSGTPSFMAPEMALADGKRIDQRTDVYLLGSCLHMLLTGLPRHDGVTLINVLTSAYLSEPVDYGGDVPSELAAICNKAMARDPKERYESAEQLRQALAEAVRHGTSIRLAREANERLRKLQRITGSTVPEEDTRRTYDLFTECRFAFREALRQWDANVEAKQGLQRALEVMASYEIEQGSDRTAAALISELPEPNAELEARLQKLRSARATQERKIEEWKQLEHDADKTIGTNERSLMMFALGVLYSSIYITLGFLGRYEIFEAEFGTLWALIVIYAFVIGAFHFIWRDVLRENEVNRRFISVIWVSVVAGTIYWPLPWYAGIQFAYALSTLLMVYFVVGLSLVVLFDMKLLPSAILLGLGAVGCTLAPYWCFEMMGGSAFLAFSTLSYLLRSLPELGRREQAAAGASGDSLRPGKARRS